MQIEQLEEQLAMIQRWIEDKDKTFEYAELYEEISRMEKELHQLKENQV